MAQEKYTYSAVSELINRFVNNFDGEYYNLVEGSLGEGLSILQAHGKKSVVIKEVFLNEWSSAHTIRMYNKLPKKYVDMIDNYLNN